jgi:hypothetical protein
MPKTTCAVVLTEAGYAALDRFLSPYLREGKAIGRYMYATKAEQIGSFVDVTFDPEDCDGKIGSRMRISMPLQFMLFMASGEEDKVLGFKATS